jgi:hypothetical protein
MNFKTMLALSVAILFVSSPSWAQRDTTKTAGSSPQSTMARFEIIPMGGYVWTVSQGATYRGFAGDIDLESNGYWGVAVDINVHPFMQGRLLYRRQDTKLIFRRAGGVTEDLGDMAVEYWHIGGVKGITKGNVKPFTSLTLGGTRYVSGGEDNWKFSVLISLGAKIYLNERIGLMVAGQMPFSFTGAWLGIGTGGASLGGTGIAQFDVTAGLTVSI